MSGRNQPGLVLKILLSVWKRQSAHYWFFSELQGRDLS